MLAAVTDELARAGFDIVHPLDARACAEETGARIIESDESNARSASPARALGLFVGNTRALWPVFVAARAADSELASATDPLELYTERTIDRIAASLPSARVYYSHRKYGDSFLPLQRLAVAAGIGSLSPSQLVIHPVYGPWFALRAVIVCDGEPPARVVPPASCSCTSDSDRAADGSAQVGHCSAAFARALEATGPERWRAWLAVRDACITGREHRYSDEQIAYHYSFLR